MHSVVNRGDAKSNLSRLVKRAVAGEVILIAKRGKLAAMLSCIPKLSGIPKQRVSIPGDKYKGQIEMADDFDAPVDWG